MINEYLYEEIENSVANTTPVTLTDDFVLKEAESSTGKVYIVENTLYDYEDEVYRPWLQYRHRNGVGGWYVVGSVDFNNYSSGILKMFKKENRHDK